jgi:hypothetical protein
LKNAALLAVDAREKWTEGLTEPPASRSTSRPSFDVDQYAAVVTGPDRVVLDDDLVLRCVPDVSWLEARLDFDELLVLRAVDGVSPILLLESFVDVPAEQLRSILYMLLARGIVAISRPPMPGVIGTSGFFSKRPFSGKIGQRG